MVESSVDPVEIFSCLVPPSGGATQALNPSSKLKLGARASGLYKLLCFSSLDRGIKKREWSNRRLIRSRFTSLPPSRR